MSFSNRIERLSDSCCMNCPYDGKECEDNIHMVPDFKQIKDYVFPRKGFKKEACSLYIYTKIRKENEK